MKRGRAELPFSRLLSERRLEVELIELRDGSRGAHKPNLYMS